MFKQYCLQMQADDLCNKCYRPTSVSHFKTCKVLKTIVHKCIHVHVLGGKYYSYLMSLYNSPIKMIA